MVVFYKNFIIIDRGDTNAEAIAYAQKTGMWFADADRIWHRKAAEDKVILLMNSVGEQSDEIMTRSQTDFNTFYPYGCLHVYVHGPHMKIFTINMPQNVIQETMVTFKNYCIALIKGAGVPPEHVNALGFTVVWDYKCWGGKNKGMCNILNSIGFLKDASRRMFCFQQSDVYPEISLVQTMAQMAM